LNEFSYLLDDQLLHLLDRNLIGHTFAFQKSKLVVFLLVRHLTVITMANFTSASLKAVLDLVEPNEHILLDRLNLEEHREALLEIANQLLQEDPKFEEWC
jgi:hypothetical protein